MAGGAGAGSRAGGACEGDESTWADDRFVRELPDVHELETDPVDAGVQSRRNAVSSAGNAPGRALREVPQLHGVQECEHALLRLPRRHSYESVRSKLRELPLGEGLAGFSPADSEPHEPLP